MNLLELFDEIRQAVETAEFHGVDATKVKVGVRSHEGEEFSIQDVYSLIVTLKAVVIEIKN